MPRLPTGTVTFLFSDIEGSTRLLQQLGDGYADLLAEYRQVLGTAFQERGGLEVDTQGDGLFIVFPRAKDAILAAAAGQRAILAHRWPAGASVKVRMGIHTGEPLGTETGYVGIDVHKAARICAAGHGGQILLSQTARDLVEEDLGEGLSLRDLGQHRLKDLAHPQRLFQIVAPDLPLEFLPLKTLDILPNNLPRKLTSFIGREREIAEIKDLLTQRFLVTLTGAGGAGKTRLALQVAAELLDQFPDGAWWVELAPLSEHALLPQALASALGVREQPGRPLMDTLLDYLRPKTLLLLLDNTEHLLPACVSLADALLRQCPSVRILVTSREALRMEGEWIYPVSPLSLPSPGTLPSAAMLPQYEAARLFIERATAARPSLRVTDRNAAAIVQICHRVDGIPLALELAAARVKALSVEQIALRLDDQFQLLTGGSRASLPRHQTLRATMDWSFGLLTEGDKTLFRRLAVFVGGFTLEAAEAVCAGVGVEKAELFDLLTRLVEKSLVVAEDREAEVRYRLLEPVRQYGLHKLSEASELSEVRARRRDFFLAFAERGYVGLIGLHRQPWANRIEAEHDNIRTALRFSIDVGHLEAASSLGAAMTRFWSRQGFLNEGWGWLQELRQQEQQLSAAARARVLSGAGLLALEIGEHGEAVRLTEQALKFFQTVGNQTEIEICSRRLGLIEAERGNYEQAGTLLDKAVALARESGHVEREAEALRQRGYVATKQADYTLATRVLGQSLALLGQTGEKRSIGFALGHLAQVYHYQGQSDRALSMLQEALEILQAAGHSTGIAYFLNLLGLTLLARGDYPGAVTTYRKSLAFSDKFGYKWGIAQALIGFGALTAARGDRQRAVRLLAAAGAFLAMTEYALPVFEQIHFAQTIEALRRLMDSRDFTSSWAEGRAMSLGEAVEYALAGG